MTCPSELTRSQYADGALSSEDTAAVQAHLSECAACRERVEALAAESRAIGAALRAAETAAEVPSFERPSTVPPAVAWLGAITVAAWALNVAWLSVVSAASFPSWLGWLIPDAVGVTIDMAVGLALEWMNRGGDPLQGTLRPYRAIALLAFVAAALWLLVRARRSDRARSLCLVLGVTAMLVPAPPVHAFEVRHDENRVTIGPDETIDDTLVVTAETVLVEGTVNGDLVAMGERITVRGSVGGTLVAMGEEVNVDGNVSGNVLAAAETLEFREALVGANVYGAGRTVTLRVDTSVAGNVALAAGESEVYGRVGRDLLVATERLSLTGEVDGDLTVYGQHVDIAGDGRVGGDVTVKVRTADDLRVAPGASVEGATNVSTWPEETSDYLSFDYYLGQALRFLAAFVTGLVLFYLLPTLNRGRPEGAGEVLTTVGIGAVALVATPVLAIVVTLTFIGAPLGIVALLAWLVGLYLAGIITAALIGRLLLEGDAHSNALTLLAGLFILFVLINVPLLGGWIRLLAVVMGLGLMVQWLRERWAARAAS